jgi:hypothetical protein
LLFYWNYINVKHLNSLLWSGSEPDTPVQWYTRSPFHLLSEKPAGEFMSSLNHFERLFSTGVEAPRFFPQLHNCSALEVMCRRREGRLAEDFINTTFSLVVFARSAVMQQKSLAFIFCRGDAGEFRLAVSSVLRWNLMSSLRKGYTSPGTETRQPTHSSYNHTMQ